MDPSIVILAADLNTAGITAWALKTIIPILLLIVGIGIIAGAKKGRYSETLSTVALVIIGLLVIVGAGLLVAFAETLAGLTFGGGAPATPPAGGPTP